MFQPEFAFDLCGITQASKIEKVFIRSRFREAGRPYNGELVDNRLEALLYISPQQLTDPPIRWWE